ncbi:MAG: hypothetical protein ACFFB2_07880 [Promethearchaeota archaeon]
MARELDVKLFGQKLWSSTDNKEYRSKIAGLGVFVNVIWVFSVFFRPIIEPVYLIGLGGIGLLISVVARLQSRKLRSLTAGQVSGGSIIGYVVSWFIVHLGYPNKTFKITLSPEIAFTINQILIFYLILIFLVWFTIPSSEVFEDIIFDLPPLISYFLLNLWKLAVILEILTLLEELNMLNPYADIIFLTIGFTELIFQYSRLFRLHIPDIILDPVQLFLKTIEGPIQTLKWSVLVILFLLVDILPFDIFSAGLVAFSLVMGITSLTTAITKIALDSGVIRSRTNDIVEESKVIIPKIFDELKQIEAKDLQEFYSVLEPIRIRKKDKIINYIKGDVLLKVPFTDTLEERAGVFLANLKVKPTRLTSEKATNKRVSRSGTKKIQFHVSKSKIESEDIPIKKKNINISSLYRITREDWEEIIVKQQVKLIDPNVVTSMMGFDSHEEFEKVVEKGIRKAVSFQENIRDRFRGVPVIKDAESSKIVKVRNNVIKIPEEISEKLKLTEDHEIELIPGKEEFLFYARIKKRKES